MIKTFCVYFKNGEKTNIQTIGLKQAIILGQSQMIRMKKDSTINKIKNLSTQEEVTFCDECNINVNNDLHTCNKCCN